MTIDQDAYLRKAKSSIGAARSLLDDEYYEYAIARAYYAMFYLAQALLLGKGLTFSKYGSTLGAFGLHFIKAGAVEQKFHRYLLDSYDLRITGDYDIAILLTQAQAEEQIIHAEEFLAMTENYLNNLEVN